MTAGRTSISAVFGDPAAQAAVRQVILGTGSIRPTRLPKLRDQVLQHLDNPQDPIRADTGAENQHGLDVTASHLRTAELYWVAEDMVALAAHSGGQLTEARWATADRPSPCGLIVWQGGVSGASISPPGGGGSVVMPIEVCSWGPAEGGLQVVVWLSRRALAAGVATSGQDVQQDAVPPLIPIASWVLPVTADPVPMQDLPQGTPLPMVGALAAGWLLMQQPTLADRRVERPEKAVRRAYARQGRPAPEVTIVDLRRRYVPQDRDPDAGAEEGRRYRHRWVVSGHWRSQPFGRERALRRQQWIPSYVKGPDGAPLLATEKVNVWRR